MGTDNLLKIKREGKKIYFYVNGEEVYKSSFQELFGNYYGFIVTDEMEVSLSEAVPFIVSTWL